MSFLIDTFQNFHRYSEESILTDLTLIGCSEVKAVKYEVHSFIVRKFFEDEKVDELLEKTSGIFFILKNPNTIQNFVEILYRGKSLLKKEEDLVDLIELMQFLARALTI